jgi:very-short-patch-repair endonuclease
MEFTKDVEKLMETHNTQKVNLVNHLTKNYRENIDYITTKYENNEAKKHGGNNRACYLITERSFVLMSNSFNMRNRYISNISDNIKCVNIAMCIENSTIGFIKNSFEGVVNMIRQQKFDKYKVDLYIPEYKLIIECDEKNHNDRNIDYEKTREDFLIGLGNSMIRFNPSDNNFDLSFVLREIHLFMANKGNSCKVIKIDSNIVQSYMKQTTGIESTQHTTEPNPNTEFMMDAETKLLIQQLVNNNKLLSDKIDRLEDLILKKLDNNTPTQKLTTGFGTTLLTLGPRLQKINPETMQLIKVYETVTECIQDDTRIKRSTVNKAVEERTRYNGFRWAFVSRDQDASVVGDIGETRETRTQNIGYIAKMNKEKTEILNVYLDRKTASSSNGYKTESGIDTCVKKFTLSNGHYYLLYESCEDELKEKFVARYGNPILYKNGVGQFDTNGIMTREFTCKYDFTNGDFKIAEKTLRKCLTQNLVFNNYTYKHIGSKLQVHDN